MLKPKKCFNLPGSIKLLCIKIPKWAKVIYSKIWGKMKTKKNKINNKMKNKMNNKNKKNKILIRISYTKAANKILNGIFLSMIITPHWTSLSPNNQMFTF